MNTAHGPAAATAGPVALDIGGGMGALIVRSDVDHVGDEIEIEAIDPPGRRTHVAVLRRPLRDHDVFAAVFGSLAAGDYALLRRDRARWRTITIVDGQVTEVDWIDARTTCPEPAEGLEPTTDCLQNSCSTAELRRRDGQV